MRMIGCFSGGDCGICHVDWVDEAAGAIHCGVRRFSWGISKCRHVHGVVRYVVGVQTQQPPN